MLLQTSGDYEKVEDLKFSIKNFIVKSLKNFDEIISVSIPGSFEKKKTYQLLVI